MTWSTVTDTPCQLGESPFWHAEEARLYWVEIAAQQVLRLRPGDGQRTPEVWQLDQAPGCIAPAAAGGLVLALRDGVWRARTWGGALQRIAPAVHDSATSRFNDGKCDRSGRLWAGTLYEPRDRPAAALWCLDARPNRAAMTDEAGAAAAAVPAAALVRKAGDATVGNGLAWSPDDATLYWADTSAHTVYAWDHDAASGAIGEHRRVFRRFEPKPAGWQPVPGAAPYGGRPDGAAVDVDGNYWCAMYEGGRLLRLAPDGRTIADIATPVRCPTMPCFGGADLRTLYLTSARQGRPADELAALPASGCVFALQVDTPGLPVRPFVD